MFKIEKYFYRKETWILFLFFICLLMLLCSGIMLGEFSWKFSTLCNQIILRYDDCQLFDSDQRQKTNEEKFFEFALNNNIKISIAIIPFSLNNGRTTVNKINYSKIQLIKKGVKKNIFEICLHGYMHKNNSVECIPSEFKNIPLEIQNIWIKKSKTKLEQLTWAKVKVFIPPFNTWDRNTIAALSKNSFSVLTTNSQDFLVDERIKFIPFTVTPKDLQYLLTNGYVDRNKKLIILNIHPHDLEDDKNQIGLGNLKKLIEVIKNSKNRIELVSFKYALVNNISFTQQELLNFSQMYYHLNFWRNMPFTDYFIKTISLSANRPYYYNPIVCLFEVLIIVNFLGIGLLISLLIAEKIKIKILIYSLTAVLILFLVVFVVKSIKYLNCGLTITGGKYCAIFMTFGVLIGFIFKILADKRIKYK